MNHFKQKRRTDTAIFIAAVVVILIIGVWIAKSDNNNDVEEDKFIAYRCAMGVVDKQLVAPSKAEYPVVRSKHIQQIDKNTFKIISYVDSPNRMGVPIRINFSCIVKLNYPEKGSCVTEDLQLSE